MNPLYLLNVFVACFDNDNDAFIPELWAQEGLRILEENMVAAGMVHRDFQDEIAEFGDVVNTRRPGQFAIRRKTDADDISTQDAVALNVQVPLDQHIYTSFIIRDGEASKSFQDLATAYMLPSMQNIARAVDRAVLGRVHGFLGSPSGRAGRLNGITSTNSKDFVLEARQILNDNKVPIQGRNLILSTGAETALLNNELFIAADKRGDGGTALENARLGRIFGFDSFMDQNVNYTQVGSGDEATGTVTNAGTAGTTASQTVSITGHEVAVGEFVNIAGNDQPTYATAATVGAGDTTAVTLHEATKYDTSAGAVIAAYAKCDVNGAYAAGYSKAINVDGFTNAPQVGQLIAFGTGVGRKTYTVIESEAGAGGSQDLYLDRPLDAALADDDLAFPGPSGSLNWAMHRECLALVTRPLALPSSQLGVMAATASYNNVGMRVTMQYNSIKQGTVVTMDVLGGVAELDNRLATVLLA